MQTGTGNYEREREALRATLDCPEISRSPNLTKILTYLCDKYFAGESAQVKEYHIALEALGRPADFDQKKDSIVRVEMHRLRRRLKQYHVRTESAAGLQLQVPEKSYIPVFTDLNAPAASSVPPNVLSVSEEPVTPSAPIPAAVRRPRFSLILSLVGISLIGLLLLIRQRPSSVSAGVKADSAPSSHAPAAPPLPPGGDEIRILCGRQPGLYVDRYGQTWDGDRYSKGGEAVQVQTPVISGGFDRNVFRGMRVGHQSYHIPVKQGIYQMELLFAETEYGDGNPLEGGELTRPFRVLVNGSTVIPELDVIAETVEPNIATSRIVTGVSPGTDGLLNIEFQAISTGEPFVNAIILRPGIPDKALPVRILCRTHRYRDSKGRVWEPDHYFRGGSSIIRPTTPAVADGEIFRGERYGKFTYSVPVMAGARYQASLYFWESWLGPGRPGGGGAGSRVFSIFCNMNPLLRRYDLITDSGADQVKIKTFRNLEPDRNGMLVFAFDAEENKALLNAIEIVDQSMLP
jgi:hypothetical protein